MRCVALGIRSTSPKFQLDVSIWLNVPGLDPAPLQVERMGARRRPGGQRHASHTLCEQPSNRSIQQFSAVSATLELRQDEQGQDVGTIAIGNAESHGAAAIL